jgi:hypothetical protein
MMRSIQMAVIAAVKQVQYYLFINVSCFCSFISHHVCLCRFLEWAINIIYHFLFSISFIQIIFFLQLYKILGHTSYLGAHGI